MKPKIICVASLCAAACGAAPAYCITTNIDWLQINGFISQAAIYTSDNNWFGDTDNSVGFDYREVGLAFSATPFPKWRFSTQLLSRKAGENDDGSIKLDHAMVGYDFINEVNWTVGIRAGRLKSPIGWYNETRDVPFTRPSIFLPQGVYLERVRNSYFFQNGAMLRGEWRQQFNTLSWHAGFHRPKVDNDELADIARLPTDNTPDAKGKDSWSAGVVYDINSGTARLGAYYEEKRIDISGDFSIATIGINNLQGETSIEQHITVLSFEYNIDDWNFTAERSNAIISSDSSTSNPAFASLASAASLHLVSPAYYYEAMYRASEHWEIFARYDGFFIDKDDKNGNQLAANPIINFRGLPAFAFYSKSYTIGAGWHPTSDWLARIEWLNVEGTGWLNVNNNEDKAPVKYWDMVAVQLSYRF